MGKKVLKVLLAYRAQLVLLVTQVQRDRQDRLGRGEIQVQLEEQVVRVHLVQQAALDLLGHLDWQDLQDRLDRKDLKVQPV